MKKIKHYVKHIDEELHGAEDYAEKYLEAKADGEIEKANKYKSMAEDELQHALYIHELATEDIARLRKVFNPPADMIEKWNATHGEYVEKTAYIKSMIEL